MKATVRKVRLVDAAREFAEGLGRVLDDVQFIAFEAEDHAGALTAGTGRAVSFALAQRGPEQLAAPTDQPARRLS